MQRTISAPAAAANSAACAGAVPGLNATPTASPCALAAARDASGIVRRLDVKRDRVGAGVCELGEVMVGVVDHQVTVEHAAGCVNHRGDRAQHDRPDRHRWDEVPVAAIEVEDPAAGGEQLVDLLTQPAEVGRIEGGRDLEVVTDPVDPSHVPTLAIAPVSASATARRKTRSCDARAEA